MNADSVQKLIQWFSPKILTNFLRQIAPSFRPAPSSLNEFLDPDDRFDQAEQLGEIELSNSQSVLVGAVHVSQELTHRSGKRRQYELVKRILKAGNHNAGIFAFYDDRKCFRLSLITVSYHGTHRQFSTFHRYTFFVDPSLPNKTFVQQMTNANFATLEGILKTFSLEAVSDEFYKEFKPQFDALAEEVQGKKDPDLAKDFALLFVIRTIFLGFVQKKGWLGQNPRFLQDFWAEYQRTSANDTFYKEWLEPLFFEALNSPPGRKVSYGHAPFSPDTQKILQMAPYLNGELFKRKRGVDDQGLWLPDAVIGQFFDFLFQYNFTVEENELYDEELELNPEFLGIIFERLTNMEQGAVYTPRVEVDLMCRLALVKWLEQTTSIQKEDLYHLFFREAGTGQEFDEYQRQGDFSPAEIRTLIERLESVTVCDPAAGSGAFLVGMLQVLDQVLDNLYSRNNTPEDCKKRARDPYERKRSIIANSLYGVEVKRWAVWISHLRLWLALFVDMPDNAQTSFDPLLPSLTFKVRVGDSLVQRIGGKTFPVFGHINLTPEIKRHIAELKKKKHDFYYHRKDDTPIDAYRLIEQEELSVFHAILDAEIQDRRNRLRDLSARQETLIPLDPTQAELDRAQATAEQRAALEREITDLEAQKHHLKDERPFIWNIEFAEIFFDKGGFDIVIGNPPYVRQEDITDPNGLLSSQEYKEALKEMVRLDFPEYFAKSPAQLNEFKKDRKPDGRSDLYTYFYIRSLRLLNPQGVHVFICSNSWLDVGYGKWLQEFFLRKAPLYLVIDNHAKRSFERADINTIISVAGTPQGGVKPEHVVRFVAFKRPFEEAALSDNFIKIERALEITRTEDYRVVPLSVAELLREGSQGGQEELQKAEQYEGDKWGGKYLRAPDIYFTILEKGKGKLVRLGDMDVDVNEGRPTGANHFFFVSPKLANEFQIEENYLKPAIMKTRSRAYLRITANQIDSYFLALPRDERWKKDKVAKYIKFGEQKVLLKSRTLMSKKYWWYIPMRSPADLIAPCGYGERIWCGLNEIQAITSNSYTEIRLPSKNYLPSIFFTLNHPIGWLFLEIVGRASLGGGLLKVDPTEYRQIWIVQVQKELFVPFNREVQSIFIECGIDPESEIPIAEQDPQPLPDRKALDDIVFDALGLTEEERKEVYRAVCQLVWDRIRKAKSV